MLIIVILALAIIVQVTAALLALRLIRVTQAKTAWLLIAAAVSLMALRRAIALFQMLYLETPTSMDLTVEAVTLVISLLMFLGIAWIAPVFLAIRKSEEALRLNESRLEALWQLGQMTSATPQEIADFALEEGVRLTKSQIGFVGFVEENGTLLKVQAWSKEVMQQCAVQEQPMDFPLEKAGLWGEAVRTRRPLVINDYHAEHPMKRGVPEGHVGLRRLLVIPVINGGKVAAVAAVANKKEPYEPADVRQLSLFMNGMGWLLERQQAQAALAAKIESMHEFQSRLIQTSSDGIIANDPDGNIILFNQGAEKILGYTREEVIGRLDVTLLYPPGVARQIMQKIQSPDYGGAGRLERYETRIVAKNGEEIPVELSAAIILEDSQEVAVVGFFRDLRERQKLLERVLESERLAAIGRLAAYLAHEIKNPLMVIGGYARQVREHLGDDPAQNRQDLDLIIDKVQELETLLAETGSYAQLAEPRKLPGDLNALLQEACHLMEPKFKQRGVELKLELAEALPQVAFDPTHLHQVALNLLKNALEAMPRGGTLTVASRHQADRVLVDIRDTGEGMTPEVLEKSLHAFFSTKPGGSGLGLAICQKVMEAHGGDISIASTPGRGTTVTLTFRV